MVNTIYLFSFVETPRKFIIAELSIRKLGSSSVLIIRLFEFTRPFLVQSFKETLQYCDEWRKFTSVSQSDSQS